MLAKTRRWRYVCRAMNEHLIADLGRFVDEHRVTMSETPGHVRLNIDRFDVSVSVLIPRGVLEWWVEVNDRVSGKKLEDWCDYAYHDAASAQDVSEDMRADVVLFIENVVARPLRIVANGRILEWNAGGDWFQAVPLSSDPESSVG